MKAFITIICSCIPFPRTRRRFRQYLKRELGCLEKKAKHITVDKQTKAKVAKSKYFNKKYYLSHYPDVKDSGMDPVEHYLTIGYKLLYNPSKKFNTNFYLLRYPDVKKADVNPLVHYITYGKHEGRSIKRTPKDKMVDYSSIKVENDTILLITHEMSLTGAPIALMKMALILQKRGIKFMVLSPVHGDLERDFRKHNIPYIVDTELKFRLCDDNTVQDFMGRFSCIFFNTIVTLELAQYIKSANKKICWVHEGSQGYEWYADRMDFKGGFANIDVVYSVGTYSQGFTNRYIPAKKSRTLLYGIDEINRTDKTKPHDKLRFGLFGVLGARKGQDLFINAIRELPDEIQKNCEFWIVGKISKNEFYYTLKSLSRGLNVHFTDQLSHDDTVRKMAEMDVVVCPSLDDPMPIVCTEAAVLSKPIICSNHTGTVGFVKDGVNGFVYRLEEDKLSDILIKAYNAREKLKDMGDTWRKVYDNNFNMATFEKNISSIFNL